MLTIRAFPGSLTRSLVFALPNETTRSLARQVGDTFGDTICRETTPRWAC
jgi:hypothetical protein